MTNIEFIGRHLAVSYRSAVTTFLSEADKGQSTDYSRGRISALETMVDTYNLVYSGKYKIYVPCDTLLYDSDVPSSIILYKVSSRDRTLTTLVEYTVYK